MRYMYVVVLAFIVATGISSSLLAQERSPRGAGRAKLEQQLWQIEHDWLKAEHEQWREEVRRIPDELLRISWRQSRRDIVDLGV
jgi:hypothetical protein